MKAISSVSRKRKSPANKRDAAKPSVPLPSKEEIEESIRELEQTYTKEGLKALLLEGLRSPSSPMTKEDWKRLRQQYQA